MLKNPDGSCIALVDNRCSIYALRPEVCRAFQPGSRMCEKARETHQMQNATDAPKGAFFMGA